MKAFTYRKFASLSTQKKHKECAFLVRNMYLTAPSGQEFSNWHEIYNTYCDWMNLKREHLHSPETLSNRYHQHLQAANISLREPDFLPKVSRFDNHEPSPSLNYAIYLDQLRSAHNVGSILRTVEAFRLGSVHFSSETPWIDQKKVQDASMGAFAWLSCFQTSSLKTLPKPFIVLETAHNALLINHFEFPQTGTIVVGNEEYGCSFEILEIADAIVKIPLRGKKNSLNVANAFAICASFIVKQHGELK